MRGRAKQRKLAARFTGPVLSAAIWRTFSRSSVEGRGSYQLGKALTDAIVESLNVRSAMIPDAELERWAREFVGLSPDPLTASMLAVYAPRVRPPSSFVHYNPL